MKRLTAAIASLKISSKIWLCMISIAFTLCTFIGILNSWYFVKLYKEDTYSQAAESLQIGSQSLEDAWQTLIMNVIGFASNADFNDLVNDVRQNDQSRYMRNKALIQEPMSYLTAANPLVDSIAVLGKNGEFYSSFTYTLKKESDPSDLFGWDLSSVHGITWLPQKTSPFNKNNIIIPVIIPISPLKDTKYLNIADRAEDAEVLILLMLDGRHVAERLALSNSTWSDKTLYIAGTDGNALNLSLNDRWYQTANSPETASMITAGRSSMNTNSRISLIREQPDYSLYARPLDFGGLSLIEILPKKSLYNRITRMNTFLAFIAFLGLALAALLSLLLSRFVTRPFGQLIRNIQNIEANTYHTPYETKYHDEIGTLNTAINSMHHTIMQQFVSLKQNERAKYRAEIQLLSEQINPHFLYNTLECINMEILGDHKESASSMVTSLADFLRIGLNYGSEIIPVSKELTHVKAYVDIMNHRFCQKILLTISTEEELEHLSILKSILQPLVENSILHGFRMDDHCANVLFMPEIQIYIYEKDSYLYISVCDNGRGIDLTKAQAAVSPDQLNQDGHRQVGLHNIYQRLCTCYGNVSITFSSIPYFKNEVLIAIPYSR